MKKTLFITLLAVLTLLSACRQTSDELLMYNNGSYNTLDARNSYAEQFKVLWNGINANYVAWEIETVDWDAVYDQYLPCFEELDAWLSKTDENDVNAKDSIWDTAESLYKEILAPLHDGHMAIVFKDLATGETYSVNPAHLRNATREDINVKVPFDLSYYVNVSHDIEDSAYQFVDYKKPFIEYLDDMNQTEIIPSINGLDTMGYSPTDSAIIRHKYEIASLAIDSIIRGYEANPNGYDVQSAYKSLLEGLLDATQTPTVSMEPLKMILLTTKDGIAYMRANGFSLSELFQNGSNVIKDMAVGHYVQEKYNAWYERVKKMHSEGTLKGVIFDVRNNGGGYQNDMQYFYGALLSSDQSCGKIKMKNGIGRLDYTPEIDFKYNHHPKTTDAITEPVVVLTNVRSVSMSEVTTAAIKQRDNGIQIGTCTWGGGSALGSGEYYEGLNYAGQFGKQGETPVYGYIPYCLCSYNGIGVIEGVGITPDIEISYDKELYQSQGRDNQFERALQYLRAQ